MKVLSKAIALLFLLAGLLTSCNGRISPPTINPTDVMETSMAFARTGIVGTLTAAPTSTPTFSWPTPSPLPPTQTPYFPTPFDRQDPEAVLRTYFDAWNRNDWVARGSLMPGNGIQIAGEPVNFVRILEVKSLSSSPTECVYKVRFEIQVDGHGFSMHNGEYVWRYHLIWVASQDSWYISGYMTDPE